MWSSIQTNFKIIFRIRSSFRIGPHNPFKTEQEAAVKNTLSGYVEPAHVNDFQFETQRRTFHSYGYAHDPSSGKLSRFFVEIKIKGVCS